jgi:hypothetical protein
MQHHHQELWPCKEPHAAAWKRQHGHLFVTPRHLFVTPRHQRIRMDAWLNNQIKHTRLQVPLVV